MTETEFTDAQFGQAGVTKALVTLRLKDGRTVRGQITSVTLSPYQELTIKSRNGGTHVITRKQIQSYGKRIDVRCL